MRHALEESVSFLHSKGFGNAVAGIILGTGLHQLIEQVDILAQVDYRNIPHFPPPTVDFHRGQLIYGLLQGKKVIVMQGRLHHYEGYSLQEITYPLRVLHRLGIENLCITNASGAINLEFKPGEIMLVEDHINLMGNSPLAFGQASQFENRFVDMSAPYHGEYNTFLKKIARQENIILHSGVYAAVVGPQLETRAEYRMLKILGADAVGMSTVPEVIVAQQLQLPVVALSVLTDSCDPDHLLPVSIRDIFAKAKEAEPQLITLLSRLIQTF